MRREINFWKVYISGFLFIIGDVLSVLFKLLSCQTVGTVDIHFYFGYEECYGQTWIIAAMSVLFIIFLFSLIFVKLRTTKEYLRQKRRHPLNVFIRKYKPQCYLWEYVIFLRRICISWFAASVNTSEIQLTFIMVLSCFTIAHRKYEPFVIHSANEMEFILLILLNILIVAHSLSSVNSTYVEIITVSLITVPFLLFIYYIYVFVKQKQANQSSILKIKQNIKYLILCIIVWYKQYEFYKQKLKLSIPKNPNYVQYTTTGDSDIQMIATKKHLKEVKSLSDKDDYTSNLSDYRLLESDNETSGSEF